MLLDDVLRYASYGWHVFPVHSMRDGVCSCGRPDCGSPGKHPRTQRGLNDATTDTDTLRRWWAMWPDANVAVDCGASNLVVLDVDPRHGGYESLDEWESLREEGPLPPTLTSGTGGGGMHKFFRLLGDDDAPSRNGWLEGVDVKSTGGYVLLPPSNHASGQVYVWRYGGDPSEPPSDLLSNVRGNGAGSRARPPLPDPEVILSGIAEGARDDTLFRYACQLRSRGLAREEAWVLLRQAAASCQPPFPEADAHVKLEQAFQPAYLESDAASAQVWSELRNLTDAGNALRMVDAYGSDVRYVPGWSWVTWDGVRWNREGGTGDLVVQRFALDVPRLIREVEARRAELDPGDRATLEMHANRSESAGKVQALVTLARSDPRVLRGVDDFDADPWLLNTPDGVVDHRTGEVRLAQRDDHLTRVSACGPAEPGAIPYRWNEFLERVQPDPEMRAYLRRAVGYTLTGSTQEKVMFVLWGTGNNGKTVFIETLRWLLGDYAKAAAKTVFVESRNERHRSEVAVLQGAYLVTCAEEIERRDRLNSGLLKVITGGDRLMANFMRQDPFEFTARMKLWLGTNYRPTLTDFGPALKKRLHLVPWSISVPAAQQIPRDTLLGMLQMEGPAIMRWAMEGAAEWGKVGLAAERVPALGQALDEMYEEQDIFAEFLTDFGLVPSESEWISFDTIWAWYQDWCLRRGDTVHHSKKGLGGEFTDRGFRNARVGSPQRRGRMGASELGLCDGARSELRWDKEVVQ